MKRRRIIQIIRYSWGDAGEIKRDFELNQSRLSILIDIIRCFKQYYLFSIQYKKNRMWLFSGKERQILCEKIGKANKEKDDWVDDYYENRLFLLDYSDLKYETTPKMMQKRQDAYRKRYNMGKNCSIQNNVIISREHFLSGTIKIGNNVLLAKNVFIDYSGYIEIQDNVGIANGVIIESHDHLGHTDPRYDINSAKPHTLIIEDGVILGSRAVINASVERIGRNARIGAGVVLRHSVPPYAIVLGNPAKIVGFSMTPFQVEEYERERYEEGNRISIEQYEKNYNKYFINRVDEIKSFLKK